MFSKEDFEKTVCFSSSAKSLNVSDSNSHLCAFMRAYKTVVCERLSVCAVVSRRYRSVENSKRSVKGVSTTHEENFPRIFYEAVFKLQHSLALKKREQKEAAKKVI